MERCSRGALRPRPRKGPDAGKAPARPAENGGALNARCFPFVTLPKQSWETGSRAFGANRDGGARAHGGCDLIFPVGTVIHAVADGVVIQDAYGFYCGTKALEVDHGTFTVRYGEIGSAMVKKGDKVKCGQKIAKVGHLVGITVPSDMLHFEMYAGTLKGNLTAFGAKSAKRKDVPTSAAPISIDATAYLNEWKKSLPPK